MVEMVTMQDESFPPGASRYHMFETGLGTCGLAWSGAGLSRVQLPEADAAAARARLERSGAKPGSDPAPHPVQRAAMKLTGFLDGTPTDFSDVMLDMTGLSAFERSVYVALRRVDWGETCTYGDLARVVGDPGAARAIGMAMGRNPWPLIVPCHRVLAAGGRVGGFSAYGGAVTKLALLAREGICVTGKGAPQPGLFDA